MGNVRMTKNSKEARHFLEKRAVSLERPTLFRLFVISMDAQTHLGTVQSAFQDCEPPRRKKFSARRFRGSQILFSKNAKDRNRPRSRNVDLNPDYALVIPDHVGGRAVGHREKKERGQKTGSKHSI